MQLLTIKQAEFLLIFCESYNISFAYEGLISIQRKFNYSSLFVVLQTTLLQANINQLVASEFLLLNAVLSVTACLKKNIGSINLS